MPTKVTTPGRTLLEEILPKDIDFGTLDKKGVQSLFSFIAEKYPDKYVDILQALNEESLEVATTYGPETSFSLDDFELPPRLKEYRSRLQDRIDNIAQSPILTPTQKNDKIISIMKTVSEEVKDKVMEEGRLRGNRLVLTADMGSKGNPTQITQILFGDLLMADHKGRPVPLPGLHGYGEGVTPAEFWAGAYGSRAGFASVQLNTQKSGFLTKKMAALPHRVRVTGEDCGARNVGIPLAGDDPDLVGHVLAMDTGGLKAGKIIDNKDLPRLGRSNEVLVRSMLTCQQPEGVCQQCSGLRESGKFPAIGDRIGVEYTRLVGEPVTQKQLCLDPDTEVRMGDFSIKKLRDIQVGDTVLGSNTDGNTFPTEVVDVFHNGLKPLYRYVFRDLESSDTIDLVSTPDHKILMRDGLDDNSLGVIRPVHMVSYPIRYMKEGIDHLSVVDENALEYLGERPTMDLEVDNEDHLFVLANGLIVSNSSKHTGGLVGATDVATEDLSVLDRLFSVPQHFPGAAILSPSHGKVSQVTKAPQGGHYVIVGTEQLYVPEGREVTVKKGDEVDEGDTVSSGIVNPSEIIKYKGIGAGRVYFLKQLQDLLKKNGVYTHLKNLEPMAREFFNRVEITSPDAFEDFDVGDLVSYSDIQRQYVPRQDSRVKNVKYSTGMFLEKPVMEYSIGTRITPGVAKRLMTRGVGDIIVNEQPPPFEPRVVRLDDILSTDKDFRVRMGGWGKEKSFLDAVRRGAISEHGGSSDISYLMNPSEAD